MLLHKHIISWLVLLTVTASSKANPKFEICNTLTRQYTFAVHIELKTVYSIYRLFDTNIQDGNGKVMRKGVSGLGIVLENNLEIYLENSLEFIMKQKNLGIIFRYKGELRL